MYHNITHLQLFQCIDKMSCPASTHIASHLGSAEEQHQTRMILNETAKPIKEQHELDTASVLCIFQLFKLIEGQNKHPVDLFERLLHLCQPLFTAIVDLN